MHLIFKPTLVLATGMALAYGAVFPIAQGQGTNLPQTQPVSIQVPSAPNEILKLATELNGLDSGVAKPWHIKLSWDEFDSDGDNVHSGSFEEFYAGPKRYKQIYAGDTLNQIDIANDSGLHRAGDQRWPNMAEYRAREAALRPFFEFRADKPELQIGKTETRFTSGKLPCLVLNSRAPLILLPRPIACFQPDTVMLRYLRASFAAEVSYSSIVQFQGHYVAKEIAFTRDGKPLLKVHVDQLGEIGAVGDDFFTSPAEARLMSGRISTPSPFYVDEYALSAPGPQFSRGMDGKVNIKMVVGKDGRVIEASATDGPDDMRKAVLKAVRKYQFRPYYILDHPVEVELQMSFERHVR